jgi:carboxynorspermidine decarboxylase
MPDVLEMPYRPDILGASEAGAEANTYRLGGLTCLAGDVMGDYSFPEPLSIGQRLVFSDMAHYTMVKTSTFNGTKLPALAIWNSKTDHLEIVREFGYDDFKNRLS